MTTLDERPWLAATFDRGEVEHMREVFQPLSVGGEVGLEQMLVGEVDRVVSNLGNLVGWFDNPRDRDRYAVPMLGHLVELLREHAATWPGSPEHLHFAYHVVMETAYKLRADPAWLEVAVWAAREQVAIGPEVAADMRAKYPGADLPGHGGYQRLVILADKSRDDGEVIRLCEQASAEGWAGNWDERIAKATKRLGAG